MIRMLILALSCTLLSPGYAADKPEINLKDLGEMASKMFLEIADGFKCKDLKAAVELAEIYEKDGLNALKSSFSKYSKDATCDTIVGIDDGYQNTAKLAKSSKVVHRKGSKVEVYEMSGKLDFLDADDAEIVFFVLLKGRN